jgi:hypothetical protein
MAPSEEYAVDEASGSDKENMVGGMDGADDEMGDTTDGSEDGEEEQGHGWEDEDEDELMDYGEAEAALGSFIVFGE